MDDFNVAVDEDQKEASQLALIAVESTEPQVLKDGADAAEKDDLFFFGFCWDTLSYFIFFLFVLHDGPSAQNYVDLLRRQSNAALLIQGSSFLVMIGLQILFFKKCGPPGMLMCQTLQLHARKNVAGMLIYLVLFLINLSCSTYCDRLLRDHRDSLFCVLMAALYVFFYSTFLVCHGAAALIFFPLKYLSDSRNPPCEDKMMFRIKFCVLLTVEVWIYIVAVQQDKKYNHTYEVLHGKADGNLLAKSVIFVTQMIIIPFAKAYVFIIISGCGVLLLVECILQPAIQIVRRLRSMLLPRHVVHLE